MANSGLLFDPAVGLYAPPTADIRNSVASDWIDAFAEDNAPTLDTESTTPAGQLIDAQTAEIEAKNAELLFLSNQLNPRVAEGRWQDALGYIYFLTRKLAEPTVVTCQVTGLNGTVIPYGALVKTDTGRTLICNRAVTIGPPAFATGKAETTFRVSETGPIEIGSHDVNAIVTVIPGWDGVDNAAAGAIGRDLETRSEFEARRAASVAANAHGSVGALFGSIANLDGVLDVAVLENIGTQDVIKYGVTVPAHGITVCIYGGEDAAIAEAIYRKKGNGAQTGGNTMVCFTDPDFHNVAYTYKIMRPTPINFWVKVQLGAGGPVNEAALEALKTALYQDFYGLNSNSGNSRIGLATTVYASRFYCPALAVEGINNIQSISIGLGVEQPDSFHELLEIQGDQEPVMATDNIILVQA